MSGFGKRPYGRTWSVTQSWLFSSYVISVTPGTAQTRAVRSSDVVNTRVPSQDQPTRMMLPSWPRRIHHGFGRFSSRVLVSSSVVGTSPVITSLLSAPGAHSCTSLKIVPPATCNVAMESPRNANEYSMDRALQSTRRNMYGGELPSPKLHCSTALSARPTTTVVLWLRVSGATGRASCIQCPSGGNVRSTRRDRASQPTSFRLTKQTRRSPHTKIARPPLLSSDVTNASSVGAGRMPCTLAEGNTSSDSNGMSPPTLNGSYHRKLAPMPASRVSCAPVAVGSAASGPSPFVGGVSAQSAVTSPTYVPRVKRRGDDIAAIGAPPAAYTRRTPNTAHASAGVLAWGVRTRTRNEERTHANIGAEIQALEKGKTESEKAHDPFLTRAPCSGFQRRHVDGEPWLPLVALYFPMDVGSATPRRTRTLTVYSTQLSETQCRFPLPCRAGKATRAAALTRLPP